MRPINNPFELFVPMDRRQALVAGGVLAARSTGAVLFADLSGFTPLMSALADEVGPQRGAEELSRQLSEVYTALVAQVHRFRGSVIAFSGDAITCWFDGDKGPRAASCALAIQEFVSQYRDVRTPAGTAYPLGIKVAVTVGAVRRFLVGDPAHQRIEVLAGAQLERAAAAEQLARPGEILLGAEVLAHLGAQAQGLGWRHSAQGEHYALISGLDEPASPDPWPEIPSLDPDIVRSWILPPLYQRMIAGQSEFLTELRQAVALFLKFSGIDFEADESAGEKLDNFIRLSQTRLAYFEGILSQLTLGDKGSYLMAIFGAPISTEDDLRHALLAALDLRNAAGQFDFIQSVQIGVNQGRVWAGSHGGDLRRTYTVQGLEVNLAARLMSAAGPGQVLVSSRVAQVASGFSFQGLKEIELKGFETPVVPYLLVGRGGQVDRQRGQPIVGRHQEREILRQRLRLLHENPEADTGSLVIEGEAGIGKSRLVSELIEQAGAAGIRVLQGEGDPLERTTPYFAWLPILQEILGITDQEEAGSLQQRVRQQLGKDDFLLERAPLLNDILPMQMPDNALTAQMTGEARATSMRQVMVGVLRMLIVSPEERSAPAILVFEDAHWIDSATWALIGLIRRSLPAVLLVIVTRPIRQEQVGSQIEEAYRRLCGDSETQYLQLTSLSADDTVELVARRLGLESLPDSIQQMVRTRSQGNPFFSEEIADALREAGILQVQNGTAVLDPSAGDLQQIDFPDTIQGVITSRIDRLSPSHQLTLKVASTIGRLFQYRILASIYPVRINDAALTANLELLGELDITSLETPEPELIYAFKHVITQEVVYNLMTFAQRKQLNQAAAEWYEENFAEELARYYPRLAYHWLKSEVFPKALGYLDRAAGQALELFSNREAVQFIQQAIELDPQPAAAEGLEDWRVRTGRRERMLGLAYFRLGHQSACQEHYERALQILGQPVPATNLQVAGRLLAELGRQLLHRMRPGAFVDPAPQAGDPAVEELARIEIGPAVYYYTQQAALLAWDILRRINLAERAGMSAAMAEGYGNLMVIAGFIPLNRVANLYRRLAWRAIEAADSAPARIYVLLREAIYLFPRCEWGQARQNLQTSMELADQLGDSRQWEESAAVLATCLQIQGEYAAARETWAEHYRRALQTESPQAQAWGLYGQGHNLLILGESEAAAALLEESLSVPIEGRVDRILDASRYGALALAHLRLGKFRDALETIETRQQLAPAVPAVSSTINEYSAVIEAVLGLREAALAGDFRLAEEENARLNAALGTVHAMIETLKKRFPINQPAAWLYAGIYARLRGDLRRARRAWQRSIQLGHENKQPYEVGRAHLEWGRSLAAGDPAAEAHFVKAVAVFEELQAVYDLQRGRAALGLQARQSS